MTDVDKVREYLQSKGQKYIPVGNMSDFITQSGINPHKFRSAFYNLLSKGEIKTDVITSSGGRKKIKGIELQKMLSVSTIIRNEAEKTKSSIKTPKSFDAQKSLPEISEYLRKKHVLIEISEKLASIGMDPEKTITFNPDPIGEESIVLLDLLGRAQTALSELSVERDQLKIDLEAEKEINKRLAEKNKITAGDYATK